MNNSSIRMVGLKNRIILILHIYYVVLFYLHLLVGSCSSIMYCGRNKCKYNKGVALLYCVLSCILYLYTLFNLYYNKAEDRNIMHEDNNDGRFWDEPGFYRLEKKFSLCSPFASTPSLYFIQAKVDQIH